MARYILKKTPLETIASDFPYHLRYGMEDETVLRSIESRGLIHPLLTTAGSKRELISGHRRFAAVQHFGWKEVEVFEIEESLEREDLFFLALMSNWQSYPTEFDKAWVLYCARNKFGIQDDIMLDEIFPVLRLPREKKWLEEALQVTSLIPEVLKLLAAGKIPYRGSRNLCRLTRDDQMEFARMVGRGIHWTSGQLRNGVSWLLDMMLPEKISLKELLKSKELISVLERENEDAVQKGNRLIESLRNKRFPRVCDYEKRFSDFSKDVFDPLSVISAEAPPSFERKGFILRAEIGSPESLDLLMTFISEKRKKLRSFFDMML